jgi:hypothetical protein
MYKKLTLKLSPLKFQKIRLDDDGHGGHEHGGARPTHVLVPVTIGGRYLEDDVASVGGKNEVMPKRHISSELCNILAKEIHVKGKNEQFKCYEIKTASL